MPGRCNPRAFWIWFGGLTMALGCHRWSITGRGSGPRMRVPVADRWTAGDPVSTGSHPAAWRRAYGRPTPTILACAYSATLAWNSPAGGSQGRLAPRVSRVRDPDGGTIEVSANFNGWPQADLPPSGHQPTVTASSATRRPAAQTRRIAGRGFPSGLLAIRIRGVSERIPHMTASCLPGSLLQLVPPRLLAAQAGGPHGLTRDRAAPDRQFMRPAEDECETVGSARQRAQCNDTAERARGRALALANPAHFPGHNITHPGRNP